MTMTSALEKAYRRESWKWCGSPGGSVPRPAPFMYAGMLRVRTSSMADAVPRVVHTWLPSRIAGFSAWTRRSASLSIASGSPAERVEAR